MILTDGSTPIALPDGLAWIDEMSWSPIVQSADHSITGALLVQAGTRQAGRPITLQASEKEGWKGCTRAIVEQIKAWGSIAGKQLSLTRNGITYAVIFRHHEPDAIQARPLGDLVTISPTHPHILTLKLMVI